MMYVACTKSMGERHENQYYKGISILIVCDKYVETAY